MGGQRPVNGCSDSFPFPQPSDDGRQKIKTEEIQSTTENAISIHAPVSASQDKVLESGEATQPVAARSPLAVGQHLSSTLEHVEKQPSVVPPLGNGTSPDEELQPKNGDATPDPLNTTTALRGGGVPTMELMQNGDKTMDQSEPIGEAIEEPPQQAFAKLVFDDGEYYMNTVSILIGRERNIEQMAWDHWDSRNGAHVQNTAADGVSRVGGIVSRDARRGAKSVDSKPEKSVAEIQYNVESDQPLLHTFRDSRDDEEIDGSLDLDVYAEPVVYIHEPLEEDGTMSLSKSISRRHLLIRYNSAEEAFEMTVLGTNGVFHNTNHVPRGEKFFLEDGSDIQIGRCHFTFHLPRPRDSQSYSHDFEDEVGQSIDNSDDIDGADFDGIPSERRALMVPQYFSSEDESLDEQVLNGSQSSENDEPEQSTPVQRKPKKAAARNDKKKKSKSAKSAAAPKRISKLKIKPPKRNLPQDAEVQSTATEDASALRHSAVPRMGDKKPVKAPPDPPKTATSPSEPPKTLVNRDQSLVNGQDINIEGLAPGTIIPARRKGPGRPPKDGVMSKRERSLLMKQIKEQEKAIKAGLNPDDLPPLDLSAPKPAPKPKPDNREFHFNGGRLAESAPPSASAAPFLGDAGPSNTAGDNREPSPEMKESDYTPEQLERPSGNYVTIIHEILKEKGRLNLQQIYVAIERKYPYFKFKQATNGWQSSVRHNLGQHDAFRKAEKDGKGFLWEINPDVPIEPARKVKKATSPQPYQQSRYQQHPQYPHQPSNGYPQQQIRPPGRMPNASPPLNDHSSYSSPYGSAAGPSTAHPVHGPHFGRHSNSPAQGNAATGGQPPPSTGSPGPDNKAWSRETLIATVSKIYAGRLDPKKFKLAEVAARAVDYFQNPGMVLNPPLVPEEKEIVAALQQAHESNITGKPVQPPRGPPAPSPSQPTASQPSATSAPRPPQLHSAHAPLSVSPQIPAEASSAASAPPMATTLSQQRQNDTPPRNQINTPQAPQPEPLTRPSSSQGPKEAKSSTSAREPLAHAMVAKALPDTADSTGLSGTKRSMEAAIGLDSEHENDAKKARLGEAA